MLKFIFKKKQNLTPPKLVHRPRLVNIVEDAPKEDVSLSEGMVFEDDVKLSKTKNKFTKKEEDSIMTTSEKVQLANELLGNEPQVKKIKNDKGLIERANSTKSIITEDNRELLND